MAPAPGQKQGDDGPKMKNASLVCNSAFSVLLSRNYFVCRLFSKLPGFEPFPSTKLRFSFNSTSMSMRDAGWQILMHNRIRESFRHKAAAINSINNPEAWSFLYRLQRDGESKGVSKEFIEQWRAGAATRSKLLRDFVTRCYDSDASYGTNRHRLESLVKLKQASKEWRRNLTGYEWLTDDEMTAKGWSEKLGLQR